MLNMLLPNRTEKQTSPALFFQTNDAHFCFHHYRSDCTSRGTPGVLLNLSGRRAQQYQPTTLVLFPRLRRMMLPLSYAIIPTNDVRFAPAPGSVVTMAMLYRYDTCTGWA